MGEYIILEDYYIDEARHIYSWVSMPKRNGPAVFDYELVPELDTSVKRYMDPGTNTLYAVFIQSSSLTVVGFQTDASGPYKAFEYWLPLRSDSEVSWLRVKDGFAYVEYKDFQHGANVKVDVIDLRRRFMSRFNLPPLPSLLQVDTLDVTKDYHGCDRNKSKSGQRITPGLDQIRVDLYRDGFIQVVPTCLNHPISSRMGAHGL